MAIVVYKCDTCKRTDEIVQNIYGLDTIGRCVITLGCRGKLSQTDYKPDFSRPALPTNVTGLTNWEPRKVLFNFTQAIASNTWVIQHNMGAIPVVQVLADQPTSEDPTNRVELLGYNFDINSVNEITIHFDRPYSGIAQLITLSSDPALLQPTSFEVPPVSTAPIQLTNISRFILATRMDKFGTNTGFNINLEFTSSAGDLTSVTYASSTAQDTLTSWSDVVRVVFKGKVYLLREFNGLTADMTTGVIPSGTKFRFKGFDVTLDSINDYVVDPTDQVMGAPSLVNQGDILLLLSAAPFGSVDKITNEYIDVTSVTTTNNVGALFYNNLEFFAAPTIVRTVYPPIRSVG